MARKIQVEILGDARSVGRAFRTAKGDAVSFGSVVERSAARARVAMVGAGIAIGGALVKASRDFSTFEQSLSRSVGLAGVAQNRIDGISQALLRLGPRTGRGPKELADAFYFVASAGIKASDQLDVVDKSARAAAAGLGETQVIADAVTSAMNAYGSDVLDAAKATDVLVATVKEGKGEAAAFAPVIGNVASLAAKLGVKFNDVGAALAAMTRLGTDPETASTQLQAFFSGVLKTAPKAEKEMKKFGLSSAGIRKELREKGLLAVLQRIAVAYKGNDEALARSFPNIRALRGLLALIGSNSKEVIGIFDRLSRSTGSLGHAFDAASKDEAFKWQKAKASVEGAFIRIGAMAAPAVEKLASGLDAGVTFFNNFLDKLDTRRTIGGKLDVVWSGIEKAGKNAEKLLGKAIRSVDWGQVWSKSVGIAEGLSEQLDRVDWNSVGDTIGQGIRSAVTRGVEGTKEIASRIHDVIKAIDWGDLGKSMGPGLAAAVVSGFLALLDPGFWARNWDLALGVALVALGGPISKLAGKIAAPFIKLGAKAVQALGVGLIDAMPRVAQVFIVELPRAASAGLKVLKRIWRVTFGELAASIAGWLDKHGIIRFVLKVTGVAVAFNVLKGFIAGVKGWFGELGEWIKRQAITWALNFLEPFTHLPGRFGAWARRAKDNLKAELAGMALAADDTQKRINESLSKIEDRKVTLTIETQYTIGPHPDEGTRGPRNTTTGPDEGTRGPKTTTTGGTKTPAGDPNKKERDALAKERRRVAELTAELARQRAKFAAQQAAAAKQKKSEKDTTDAKKKASTEELNAARAISDAAKKAKEAWQRARDEAKQSFGSIFQGPLLGGPLAGAVQAGAPIDPKLVLQDMRMQNQATAKLLANIREIGIRGAPKELVAAVRELGLAGAPIAEAIATAPDKVFAGIVKAFRDRQSELQAETVMIRARTVSISGPTGHPPPLGLPAGVRASINRATGGTVPGSGMRDTVPAMLTPGELVLNRRQQAGLASHLGIEGASPQQLFAHVQHFADGGVVQKMNRWLGEHSREAYALTHLGDYFGRQGKQFVANYLPTPEGLAAMARMFGDLGLAFLPGKLGAAGRRRSKQNVELMVAGLIRALKDPINNAGLLAAMAAPMPFPRGANLAKLTRAERAADAAQTIARATGRFETLAAHAKTAVGASRLGKKIIGEAARPFDEVSALARAREIFADTPKQALPPGVRSPKDLVALMRSMHASAIKGEVGRLWYEDSGLEILRYTRGNKAEAEKIAQLIGIYSANTKVGIDLQGALQAYEMYQRHKTVTGVNTADKDFKALGVMQGRPWTGRKTNNFYLDLMRVIDPKTQASRTSRSATMDIWMRRAFGYRKNAKGEEPITTGMYDFMEKANAEVAKQLGWQPHQTQAAIWTVAKARHEGITLGQAALNYGDFMRTMRTHLNYEVAHGMLGDQIQDILGERAARLYADEKIALFRREGGDLLDELGILGTVAERQTGISDDRLRPGFRDVILAVKAKRVGSAPATDIASFVKESVEELAAARGYALKQWGVGWLSWFSPMTQHGTLASNMKARRNALLLTQELPKKQLAQLTAELAKENPGIITLPVQGGYIIKEANDALKLPELQKHVSAAVAKLKGKGELQFAPVVARSGLVTEDQYESLIRRATARTPGFGMHVARLRQLGDAVDERWAKAVADAEGRRASVRRAAGGVVPGRGASDNVPALLTPGELVLNRRQQGRLASVLGMRGASPESLFRTVSGFASGGIIGRPSGGSMLPSTSTTQPAASYEQHNTITVPPAFSDTQWAIERGLARASWRLKNGV